MSHIVAQHDLKWLKERLQRHTHELFRLAWPVMLSRTGIVTLAIIDTVMVGLYATDELAFLNLGGNSFIMVFLVVAIGLLMGTLIHTSHAFGAGNHTECGQVFRRSLPYAFWVGLAATIMLLPGETYFQWTGQTEIMAREGGRVMTVLSIGIIGHLIYVNGVFFLEGLSRPKPAVVVMMLGNILNIGLNYIFIFGKLGFPEMGAVGSAWATTVLRILMAVGMLGYIYYHPSFAKYEIWTATKENWKSWAAQRVKGYAAGFSLGVEVIAFAALSLFAGWLGTQALAAYGVIFNIMTVPFMITAGLGAATAIRVGIGIGRDDIKDTALAGLSGFALGGLILIISGVLIYIFNREIFSLYTDDMALVLYALPLVAFAGYVIVVDGGQMILANALRGLGETWVPTGIQTFVYVIVMIPLSYWLAFSMARGVLGLLESVLYASIVSIVLQGFLFYRRTAGAYPLVDKRKTT